MANSTLDHIAKEFGKALEPVSDALSSTTSFEAFMSEMGWDVQVIPTPIQNLGTAITDLQTKLAPILDDSATLQDWNNLRTSITTLVQSITNLQSADFSTYTTLVADNFKNIFPKQLIDYMLISYLRRYQPVFFQVFRLMGVINNTYQTESGNRPSYVKDEIIWSNLPLALSNTESLLNQVYGWGSASFNASDFLTRVQSLLNYLGVPAYLKLTDPGELSSLENGTVQNGNPSRFQLNIPIFNAGSPSAAAEAGVVLAPLLAVNTSLPGLALLPYAKGAVSLNYQITPNLLFNLASHLSVQGGIAAVKRPGEDVKIYVGYQNSASAVQADGGFEMSLINSNANGKPIVVIGSEGGSRVEYQVLSIESGLNFTNEGVGEIYLEFELVGGKAVIGGSGVDSFLRKILPKNGIEADFQLTVGISSVRGLYFKGGGGLEIFVPSHFSLGPIEVNGFKIAATPSNGKIPIKIGADIALKLGPLTAVVENIGLQAIFDFPGSGGNLGPVDLDLAFKPPTGIGLSIKNDTITGAGYLSFNKDEGRYVGALELTIKKKISVKAIGIVTTKLPGGQPGYSFLLLVTVEGFQPIPLGFGFTLNGVGGLIALHRRMNTDALLNGVKTGAIENIMFPKNPVENINSIIDTLETVFPIEEGRFSFGPVLRIGWGSPTLITADIGLFMEFPNPEEIAIIGIIRAILPSESNPVVKLQIAFAGVINFEQKYISFNATLINSSLLSFPLEGDMVFRLRWGDQPIFVFSVGGFHPQFKVPDSLGIPAMRRMTLNLIDGDNPRLTLTSYFAITSNSVQFEAAIDFYYGLKKIKLVGYIDVVGHLGFDALIYFNPFHFRVNIDANLAVRRDGDSIMTITLSGMLEGPKRWHVQGNFKFEVFGVEFEKDFDRAWGETDYTTLPDVQVLPKLTAALQDSTNWQTTPISNVPLLVTLRELTVNPGELVVHPQTAIAVNQKVVPLNTTISRFGNARPTGTTNFMVDISYSINPNTPYLQKTDLKEFFSPNEFFELSEGERLNRASFEKFPAGMQVSSTSNKLVTGGSREMQYLYETIVMDSRNYPIYLPNETPLEEQTQDAFRGGSAVSRSALGAEVLVNSGITPPPVVIAGRTFAVATTDNLTQMGNTAQTQTEAQLELEIQLALNPALEGKLQIVNTFELP